jgi:uncharacterized protein (TIGR02646 family)
MLHVKHNLSEPNKLRIRKSQLDGGVASNPMEAWNKFSGKDELRQDLLLIQKGLCAYCENKLNTDLGYHIEHIVPKAGNPHLTFEYTNLILSCIASEQLKNNTATSGISCGHAKKSMYDKDLFVSPASTGCERYFRYELNGEIVPNPHLDSNNRDKATYTIDLLKLNCLRLIRERESIMRP